jgi:choline monooxygenase
VAETLPAAWYRDGIQYAREREQVWAKEWLMFAPVAALTAASSYVAAEVAGFPVFVTVRPDGELVGFHNVCPHRAGPIVWPGTGTAGNLVCRYHGWAFNHDGALIAARDFGEDPGLCLEDNALVPVQVAVWKNFVFVNLDRSAAPLADSLGGFGAACDQFPMETFTYGYRLVRDLKCNWKTYADNYLEGYHVSLLHRSLARALDMSTYRVEVPDDGYCVHTCNTTEGSPSGGAWLYRYPNLAVNIYADGMNVERIVPVSVDHTQVVYDYFLANPNPESIAAMVEMSNVVLDEDQAICEAVQRNLDAGIYTRGRLSPKHEAGLAWFQCRIATAVG